MLQHRDAVRRGEGHRAARAALAHDDRDERHAEAEARLGGARDRLGLAALLGALAGVGAGRVHQRDHRQAEAVGHLHQADRLAVALGAGHAEVALQPRLGVVALLVADHHDGPVVEPCEPADHRVILGEVAVAGERRELGEERVDVVRPMRALRVAGDLGLPPGREVLVELGAHGPRLGVERLGLGVEVHAFPGARERAQLFRLALELGERLFEIEIDRHDRLSVFRGYMTTAPGGCNRARGRPRPERRRAARRAALRARRGERLTVRRSSRPASR
jgi:hypothetical protein